MPAYRLPLELELHILELATPHALLPSLKRRVDFLLNVALVHRSFTSWAQTRLREQFVFTYRDREGERERFQRRRDQAERLSDWKPKCFLLDCRELFYDDLENRCDHKSHRRIGPGKAPYDGLLRYNRQILESGIAIKDWPARFGRSLIRLPHTPLLISSFACPTDVDVDNSGCGADWGGEFWCCNDLDAASIVLRHFSGVYWANSMPFLTQLVLVKTDLHLDLPDACASFPNLVHFVSFDCHWWIEDEDLSALPASLRRVCIASCSLPSSAALRMLPISVPASFKSLEFILLRPDAVSSERDAAAAALAQASASLDQALSVLGVRLDCRVANRSNEEELADVMISLGM